MSDDREDAFWRGVSDEARIKQLKRQVSRPVWHAPGFWMFAVLPVIIVIVWAIIDPGYVLGLDQIREAQSND